MQRRRDWRIVCQLSVRKISQNSKVFLAPPKDVLQFSRNLRDLPISPTRPLLTFQVQGRLLNASHCHSQDAKSQVGVPGSSTKRLEHDDLSHKNDALSQENVWFHHTNTRMWRKMCGKTSFPKQSQCHWTYASSSQKKTFKTTISKSGTTLSSQDISKKTTQSCSKKHICAVRRTETNP